MPGARDSSARLPILTRLIFSTGWPVWNRRLRSASRRASESVTSYHGAEYMNIADELAKHAAEELGHALIISNQIDYLGGMPSVTPKTVRTSEKATDMLKFDLENEKETIENYRDRVKQCEELGEYAMAEHIREIL